MATWTYDIETRDGYDVTILVHVVEGKEKVTLVICNMKKKEVAA